MSDTKKHLNFAVQEAASAKLVELGAIGTDADHTMRHALGRWHLSRPGTLGGVIYVSDSPTGIPHEGTACFNVYSNTSAEATEALAQWLLDQLHARDVAAGKGSP